MSTVEKPTEDVVVALQERIDKALDMHREFEIYDECDHEHEDPNKDGVIEVEEFGLTCEDGYQYSICWSCCTGGSGYQTEECATHHQLPCWPCTTHRVLTGGEA